MKANMILNPDILSGKFVVTTGEQWYIYGKGDNLWTDCGYTEGTTNDNSITNKDFKGNRKGIAKLVKRVETERTSTYKFNCASTGSMAVKALFYGGAAKTGTANSTAFAPDSALTADTVVLVGNTLLKVTTAGTTGDAAPDVAAVKTGDPVTSGTVTFESLGTVADNTIATFKGGSAARDVSAIYVMDTEESEGVDGASVIAIIPNGSIAGTGTPTVQDFDGYEFTLTVTANDTFMPLSQYGTFDNGTSDIIIVVVPNDRVEDVVNDYAAALKAYRDAL